MKRANTLDPIDRRIIEILYHYEELGVLELWYELGETDPMLDRITQEELSIRLKSLSAQGLLEQVEAAKGVTEWCLRQGRRRLRRLGRT